MKQLKFMLFFGEILYPLSELTKEIDYPDNKTHRHHIFTGVKRRDTYIESGQTRLPLGTSRLPMMICVKAFSDMNLLAVAF